MTAEDDFVTAVLNDVMELPDRTSPDDWPEACLVEGEELDAILRERIPMLRASPSPPAMVDARCGGPAGHSNRNEIGDGQRAGSGVTHAQVKALVCRCVTHGEGQEWLTGQIMALITGKA